MALKLLENLESKVAIIYGREVCLVGNHGSHNRMKFGSQLPSFWEIVGRLSRMDFGSIVKYMRQPHYKRMQPDLAKRCALASDADAWRYVE